MGRKQRKRSSEGRGPRRKTPPLPVKRFTTARPVALGVAAFLIAAVVFHFFFRGRDSNLPSTRSGKENSASGGSGILGQSTANPRLTDFVGSEACAACHRKQYDLWKKSTHGRAGGAPSEAQIIARFDGQPLEFKDAVVTPLRKQNGECVFVIQEEGMPKMEIEV